MERAYARDRVPERGPSDLTGRSRPPAQGRVLALFIRMATKRRIVQQVEGERAVGGGRELRLTYRIERQHPVPAVLLLPETASPAPAAVLVHGYSSRKEDVSGPVGRALLGRGIASLALDLPLHGTRADPVQRQSVRDPLAMVRLWRQAISDVRAGLRYLGAHPRIDGARLALVGYSMGSFLSVVLAETDPAVRAVVLAAGGDLPEGTPFAAVARMVADPLRSVRNLRGRPLLMVHGRRDRTVTAAQAQRLFDAATQPKEILWYDAGHYLPAEATEAAAVWLQRVLGETAAGSDHPARAPG